jgi:hypothetical protein
LHRSIRGEEFKISVRDKLGKFEAKKMAGGPDSQSENRNLNSMPLDSVSNASALHLGSSFPLN